MDRYDVLAADEIWGKGKWPQIDFGAIVCAVTVSGCMPAESLTDAEFKRSNGLGDFRAGRYAWALEDVRRFVQPIACVGRQRWWNVPLDLQHVPNIRQKWRLKP